MKRVIYVLCFGASLLVAAHLAAQSSNTGGSATGGLPAGFPPDARADYWNDPRFQEAVKRLAKVREWQATMDIKIDYSTTGADPQHPRYSFHKFVNGFLRSSVKGSFKLKRDPRNPQDVSPWWDADGTARMDVHFETHELHSSVGDALDVPEGTTTKGSHRIQVGSDSNSYNLGIQPDGKLILQFSGDDMRLDVTGVDTYMESGKPKSTTHRNTAGVYLVIHDIPLPADTLRLQGTKQMSIGGGSAAREAGSRANVTTVDTRASSGGIHPIWDINNPPQAATVKYDLVPVVENLKLNVFIDEYDTWIPEGNKEAAEAGNELKIRAELKTLADAPPEVKANRIKFELVEASDEPGTAMNWPLRGGDTNLKDLRFDPSRNRRLKIPNPMGLEAATEYGEHDKAQAVLSSYDYGAFGTLKVTAELPYGIVVGKLVYNNQEEILLPKRPNDKTKIADAWKQQEGASGLADESDDDAEPQGDPSVMGDGLTLYEEYRGFFENGEHFRSKPKEKDFFVCDKIGGRTKRGIQVFATATGLHMHHQLREEELGEDRLINCNYGYAHQTDQHGVLLVSGDPGFMGGRAVGGPGTPKKVGEIRIHPGLHGQSSGRVYDTIVAHELCHAVNVFHHGDKDPWWVEWKSGLQQGKRVVFERKIGMNPNDSPTGEPRIVDVYLGEGKVPPERFTNGVRVFLGKHGGQHSGDSKCLMVYVVAGAYEMDHSSRRWIDANDQPNPEVEDYLCNSTHGTPSFGDAAVWATRGPRFRGNCKAQVRVSDK